jgi:hypothetical protein
MARKIIPLKYKPSPFTWTWTNDPTQQTTGFQDFIGRRIEDQSYGVFDYNPTTRLEAEFASQKQDLIGMKDEVGKNIYADLVNPYAGLTDQMASLENVAEDLTVDQRAFEQQKRTLQSGLSQALEASKQTGVSSAQVIANQLSQASGDISASIGAQESANERLRIQQAADLQLKKAQSAQQTDLMKRQGKFQTDMQMRKGEEDALARTLNLNQALLSLTSGEIAREDLQTQQDKGWLQKFFHIW